MRCFYVYQGVIHRDIKAENFLYRTKESAIDDFVLIDFGIAKVCRNSYSAVFRPGDWTDASCSPLRS